MWPQDGRTALHLACFAKGDSTVKLVHRLYGVKGTSSRMSPQDKVRAAAKGRPP